MKNKQKQNKTHAHT